MEVSLNPSLLTQLPELKIGIIHYTKIVVAESPQMIKGRLQLYQENLYLEMQEQPVTERKGIAEWRQLWKSLAQIRTVIVTRPKASCAELVSKII